MPEENPSPLSGNLDEVFGRREFLYPAEIAALFQRLNEPQMKEYRSIAQAMIGQMQVSNNALMLLTGDGKFEGQLSRIIREQDEARKRQGRILRRLHAVEKRGEENERIREIQHGENKLEALKFAEEQNKKLARLSREIRAMRRNQLWVVRYLRRFYDWATAADDSGRYSKAKLAAFFTVLISIEESGRHYVPPLWHRCITFLQTHIRL